MTRSYRKKTYEDNPTANETTKRVIEFLLANGFHAWRNNTYGIWDEKAKKYLPLQYQQRGVADILGFSLQEGRFLAIEIKAGEDILSKEQIEFLGVVHSSNAIVMMVHDFSDFLKKWERRFPNAKAEQ